MTVLLLAVAGGLGAATRFVLDGVVGAARRWRFPLATTLINLTGSFALGMLAGLVAVQALGSEGLLVLGTGFLGGYTTFSTAAFETVRLAQERRVDAAVLYGVGVLVVGTALAAAGYALGSAIG